MSHIRNPKSIIPLLLLYGLLWIGITGWCQAAPPPRIQPTTTKATLLQFKAVRELERVRLQFQIDGPVLIEQAVFVSPQVLEIQLSKTRTRLPARVPVDAGAITELRFAQANDDLKIAFHMDRKLVYSLSQEPGVLEVVFDSPPSEKLVTLNLDNEPLGRVLLMLSRQYGANIVAGSDVNGSISIHLTDVPLKIALDQILEAEGYRYEETTGGVLRVVRDDRERKLSDALEKAQREKSYRIVEPKHLKASELAQLFKDLVGESGGVVSSDRTNTLIINTTQEQWNALEPLIGQLDREPQEPESGDQGSETGEPQLADVQRSNVPTSNTPEPAPPPVLKAEIIRLSYSDPDEVSSMLSPLLSPQGTILVLKNNSKGGGGTGTSRLGDSVALGGNLMVRDVPEIVAQMQELAAEMDVPVEQVEIRAYIVEGTLTQEENIGIDWRAVDGDNELSASLPFGGQFSALQLRVGNLSARDFAGVLQMLSSRTDTRILSNPKIMTVGGRPAIFQSGDQIPYTEVVVSQNVESVATGFKDTGIILEVSARVKRDNMVSLTLLAEVSDVSGFTPTGQPRITGRTASTQILVADGDTAVLGGLVMNRSDETVSRVPLLGDIPLLGQLFRTKSTSQVKSEVTVFITPRIVRTQ